MMHPPYPRYKPSGVERLGDVPEHWDVKRLRRLARLQSGVSITSDEMQDRGDYPVFGGNGVRGFTTRFTHSGDFVRVRAAPEPVGPRPSASLREMRGGVKREA